jgi:hypothetical protein
MVIFQTKLKIIIWVKFNLDKFNTFIVDIYTYYWQMLSSHEQQIKLNILLVSDNQLRRSIFDRPNHTKRTFP